MPRVLSYVLLCNFVPYLLTLNQKSFFLKSAQTQLLGRKLRAVKLFPLKSSRHLNPPSPSPAPLWRHINIQICCVPASPFPLNIPHLSRTSFGTSSCCSTSYHAHISDGCLIPFFASSSLTGFLFYSLALV